MARPRKDSGIPAARDRIIESFWDLLETSHINDIGIKTIINHAECSRSTFYRYYYSVYDVFEQAIAREVVASGTVQTVVFQLGMGELNRDELQRALTQVGKRLVLAINNGGVEFVTDSITKSFIKIWSQILKIEASQLNAKSRVLISYEASGIVNIFYQSGVVSGSGIADSIPYRFLEKTATCLIDNISYEQGVSTEDVRERIKSFEAEL